MIKVISVETTREIERAANAGGLTYEAMMQNAGNAVAERVLRVIQDRMIDRAQITVLVGPGNNGGDGLVAAAAVGEQSNAQVRCYLLQRRSEDDPQLKAARDAGLFIANAEDDQRYRVLYNMVASAHVLVDALFGIGARLPIEGEAEKLLRQVHAALHDMGDTSSAVSLLAPSSPTVGQRTPRPYIVAVDCPSGLDNDTGNLDKLALHADETVTFIGAKPGQFIFPGAAAVGTLYVAPIGIPEGVDALKREPRTVVTPDHVRASLPERSPGSHKGTFGKVLIVGGSVNYTGAPALCAEGAYRAGAGLVSVAGPPQAVSAVGAHLLEATYILLPHDMGVLSADAAKMVRDEAGSYNALLIGPGLGREDTTRQMLERLIDTQADARHARRTIGFGGAAEQESRQESGDEHKLPALVIDADGLFLLSKIDDWWRMLPADTVLTPHPGEMAQLSGLSIEEIQANRWTVAAEKAAAWNVVLVLKGAHTLIAEPGGQVAVLPFKNAALATAGTGDVLAGMIAALRGQGLSGFEAAVAAGYVHGLAGELMAEQVGTRGTIASDIARYGVPQALRMLENYP